MRLRLRLRLMLRLRLRDGGRKVVVAHEEEEEREFGKALTPDSMPGSTGASSVARLPDISRTQSSRKTPSAHTERRKSAAGDSSLNSIATPERT